MTTGDEIGAAGTAGVRDSNGPLLDGLLDALRVVVERRHARDQHDELLEALGAAATIISSLDCPRRRSGDYPRGTNRGTHGLPIPPFFNRDMNTKLFLPLALALPMFASCEKAADAADNAAGAAAGAADSAKSVGGDLMGALGDMTPDAIKAKGGDMVKDLAEKLGQITDVASAKSVVENWLPKIADLSAMKDKLGASLPNMDTLTKAVADLKTKFAGQAGIMKELEPLLSKLTSMMS